MKKTTIFIIALLSTFLSFSQEYHKFPTSNAIWNYKIVGSLSYPYEWPVTVDLGGEITIGSYDYVEVYRNSYIVGAIREDTLQKKVYFHNFTNEIVLYDFSLEVDDTIYYSTNLNYNLDYYKVVNSISTIEVSGQLRKVWYLTNSYMDMPDIWIEGIGSVYRYGLLYPNDPDIVMDASTPIFGCFSHDTITYIVTDVCASGCPCNDWLVENEENVNKDEIINIFPNPVKNCLKLTINDEIFSYKTLQLFSSNAKLISEIEIVSDQFEIDMGSMADGVYYIKLLGDKKTTMKKFIKISL
ncbi:MAG: hypothetical protein C0596_05965 [Marinilabiliales bacterium]|nr:MAG: hypothetical protein C0596_05965 [Marinilabiliales bacterium]